MKVFVPAYPRDASECRHYEAPERLHINQAVSRRLIKAVAMFGFRAVLMGCVIYKVELGQIFL